MEEHAKSSGRTDGNLESVQKRFRTFQEQITPVVETLHKAAASYDPARQRSNVVDIAGDRFLDDVWI